MCGCPSLSFRHHADALTLGTDLGSIPWQLLAYPDLTSLIADWLGTLCATAVLVQCEGQGDGDVSFCSLCCYVGEGVPFVSVLLFDHQEPMPAARPWSSFKRS